MDASERRRQAGEEAASWWLRLQSADITRAEREEFVDWLRESAVHVAEMLQVAKLHNALEQFSGWENLESFGPSLDEGRQNVVQLRSQSVSGSSPVAALNSNPRRSRPFLRFAMAAGLSAVVLSALILSSSYWTGQTIQTQRGERREVSLSDGSVVEIDPETRFLVAFEEHTRRIVLKQGRALFKVAKNPQRPFLVDADGTTIRAVGTAFGVERQPQGVVVTVAEGKVGVFASDTFREPATSPTADNNSEHPRASDGAAQPAVFLTADQQVTVSRAGIAVSVHSVNSDRELAWARGQLVLDNETIAAAVAEFNRYNRLQLHLANEVVARRSVSGIFNASDPESFVEFLQTVIPVQVTRSESEIIVR